MSDSQTPSRPPVRLGLGPGGQRGLRSAVEKPKDFWGTLKRLVRYLRPQSVKLIIVIILAIGSTAFAVYAPRVSGNAVNEITNGFVAKTLVNQISKMQAQYLPQIKDTLDKLSTVVDQAVAQAQEEVKKQFQEKIAQEKPQAYAQAEDKVREELKQNPPPELVQKEQQAMKEAEEKAKAQVDQEFQLKFPGVSLDNIPGYAEALQSAQEQAAAQAKAQVDAEFLAQAIAQAKAQVDAEFNAQLEKAQQDAGEKAKEEAQKGFLEKANLTPEQLSAMEEIASIPVVNTISDFNKRADAVQEIIGLAKNLPLKDLSGNQEQGFKVSQTDLDKGIAIIRENGGSIPFTALGRILLFLLLLYFFSAFLTFLVQYLMSDVAQNTAYSLRKELYEKLTVLPLRYYDNHTAGEIMSRMTNDLDTISMTLQQSITQLIVSATQIVGFIYMMFTISGKLTLIALATLPLYVLVMAFVIRKSQKFFLAQQVHLGRLSSHAEEMFFGHNIVKAFGHEKDSISTFQDINGELYKANWKAQFISGVMMPLTNFVSNIGYVLIAVFGGIFITKNYLNLGDITAFIQYSRSFSQPIVQIANISNVLQSTMACAERVFAVLDEKEETPDPEDAVVLTHPRGEIAFDQVTFSYTEDKPLFENLNLEVKEGDTVAIVGPTGAGKTTLVNLLMRFYDVQKGKITFDRTDIRKFRRGDLRTKFGMVLQDTWLFNGTIRENIAYGRENATEEEIVAAAKAAYADHFIRSLPEGYDTVINEDASNISAGEKQLLTIARAFLANPVVLILDEATSSVDTRTEVLIQKAMGTLMKGRTNFVIAHRLSTIRDAQNILVMNHGKIVEQGTHKELLSKKGFYAELYYSQFTGAEVYQATD